MAGSAFASNLALDVAQAPRLWRLWAIGTAGCAAAGATLALALASDGSPEPVARAITVDWIVLSYILAGLIAWWCRPESRFGPLMVARMFSMKPSMHAGLSTWSDHRCVTVLVQEDRLRQRQRHWCRRVRPAARQAMAGW